MSEKERTIEEAKAKLAEVEAKARLIDDEIEKARDHRRALARAIESLTIEIQRLTPPNPIPGPKIG